LESEPDAYKGSVLDLDKSKEAYEALIAEADELAPEDVGEADTSDSESMAERLRDALADRALGGVLSRDAGVSAVDRIAEIRAKWAAVGPVPGTAGTALDERFAASCALALTGAEPVQVEKEE
jgi:hypothetical protein